MPLTLDNIEPGAIILYDKHGTKSATKPILQEIHVLEVGYNYLKVQDHFDGIRWERIDSFAPDRILDIIHKHRRKS